MRLTRIVYNSPHEEKIIVKAPEEALETIEKLQETPVAPMIDETDIKDYGLSRRLFREKIDPGIEIQSREQSPLFERHHKHKRCICSHH